MHSKSDNIEIMISDEAEKIIEKPCNSLKIRYQNISQWMNIVIYMSKILLLVDHIYIILIG